MALSPPSRALSATSPTAQATAYVVATLERDLEDERRARREQVDFLNRAHAQERELLVARTEALERQLNNAHEIWDRERLLLVERLVGLEAAAASTASGAAARLDAADRGRQVEATALAKLKQEERSAEARSSSMNRRMEADVSNLQRSAEAESVKASNLEIELKTVQNHMQSIAKRLASSEVELATAEDGRAILEREHQRALEASAAREVRLKAEATEKRSSQDETATERSQEIHQLSLEVQQLISERCQILHEADAQVRRERAEADARFKIVRLEYEAEYSENRDAMMRALWQLQVADECVQSLRQDRDQLLSVGAARRQEVGELANKAAEESSTSQRLADALALRVAERRAADAEQRVLTGRVQILEEELRASRLAVDSIVPKDSGFRCGQSDKLPESAQRERSKALAIIDRHRDQLALCSSTDAAERAQNTWLASSCPVGSSAAARATTGSMLVDARLQEPELRAAVAGGVNGFWEQAEPSPSRPRLGPRSIVPCPYRTNSVSPSPRRRLWLDSTAVSHTDIGLTLDGLLSPGSNRANAP